MVNKDIKLYSKRKLKEIKKMEKQKKKLRKKISKNYTVLGCSVLFGLAGTINIICNKKELKKLETTPVKEQDYG